MAKTGVEIYSDHVVITRVYPDTTIRVRLNRELSQVLESSHPFEEDWAYGSLIIKFPHICKGVHVYKRWIRVRNYL